MATWALASMRINEHQLRRRLAKRGRTTNWNEVECYLADGHEGTLIIESPTLGWNLVRVWWATDSSATRSAPPRPSPEELDHPDVEGLSRHPFYLWCIRTQTNPNTGSARLVATVHGGRRRRRLDDRIAAMQARHANLGRLDLWSGPVFAADECNAKAAR